MRGEIREGWFADVVIFDPLVVADQATFEEPHQYPIGIKWVVINGKLAVEEGVFRDVRAGRVLRRHLN